MKRGFLSLNASKKNTPQELQKRVVDKFAKWKSPFLGEDRLKTLELMPARQRYLKLKYLEGWINSLPDQVQDEYRNKAYKQQTKLDVASASAKAEEAIYTNFLRWLAGNGTAYEKTLTPWAIQSKPPAFELPEVRALFDGIIDELSAAEKRMVKLIFKGPQSLNDYWLWYKFIIQWDEMDETNPWQWLDMVPPPEDYPGQIEVPGPFVKDMYRDHTDYPEDREYTQSISKQTETNRSKPAQHDWPPSQAERYYDEYVRRVPEVPQPEEAPEVPEVPEVPEAVEAPEAGEFWPDDWDEVPFV